MERLLRPTLKKPEREEEVSKWIEFEQTGDTGKTKRWEVNTKKDILLGYIKWYSPWRKYCFFPIPGTVYAFSCLGDISEFIKEQMRLRRLK